jgi:MFS family permease
LGGPVVALGVIEGAADAVSSALKLVAGRLSDRVGRRKPLVITGYALASFARPLTALATSWQHIFVIRLVDRAGKGLRGAPRDAMLAALASPNQRGRVFGFHRAMDHAGAVVGPLGAALFLWLVPGGYRQLFALTIVPGAIAVALLFFVPDVRPMNRPAARTGESVARRDSVPAPLKRFLVILAIFTLGNSTDAFLLLKLSEAGLSVTMLPLLWAALHVVKAGLSTSGGTLSDRFGRRVPIVAGWVLYAVVYVGFALSTAAAPLIAWFLTYGVYYALVEGSERALVVDLAPDALHGTAFGWYNAVLGAGALASSVLFGFIWQRFGAPAAFLLGAALSLTASLLLLTAAPKPGHVRHPRHPVEAPPEAPKGDSPEA